MTPAIATLPGTSFQLPIEVIVLGVIAGLTSSLLAMGLVLTYRSSRVINFAHGEMGALGGLLVPILVTNNHLGYWPAVAAALAASVAAGAFTELVVVRRLGRASRLVGLVATIGLSQLFFAIETLIPKGRIGAFVYPTPFDADVTIGTLHLDAGSLLILGVVPPITLALALFLRATRLGLAGIRVQRVSLLVWMLAGLLAGISGILLGPTHPVVGGQALGPGLLLRALAAAMIGGLDNLAVTFAAGIGIGVLGALVQYNHPTQGTLDIVLFAVILVSFLARRRLGGAGRTEEGHSWSLVDAAPARDAWSARTRGARLLRSGGPALAVAVAAAAAVPMSNAHRVLLSSIVLFAIMGLSLVVLTGFAGQVSLGQFAFVGLGALVGGRMNQLGYPAPVALLYSVLAGGLAAVVVGLPALRIRGLFLAVTTLAFAVASYSWLYGQSWLVEITPTSTSLAIPRPHLGAVDLTGELGYYWACLVVLVFVAAVVDQLRRTGVGRTMLAVRDNQAAAAAMGISVQRVKLTAFVVSGMIAALGGYLYGGLLVNFTDLGTFSPDWSLILVALVVLGGVTTITGAIAGSVWVLGLAYLIGPLLPSLLGGQVTLLVSGVGLLGAVLQFPSGIAGELFRLRDGVLRRLAPAAAVAGGGQAGAARPAQAVAGLSLEHHAAATEATPTGVGVPALEAIGVVVAYGGRRALDGVSLHAQSGEVVGLVGPNGAGKTTLFDVLSGQTEPDMGMVRLGGREVTWLPPEKRARLGLGRSFQQARLYDGLTVVEALKVALECREPSELVPSVLGLPPSHRAEHRKALDAERLVQLFGLGPFASRRIAELSTGVRRLAELACIVGLGARTLLLDEPTAGIAQREVESFVPVLRALRDHLDATIVVIEHDIPMVTRLVDRMYVMAAGRVIAEGRPEAVRDNPDVIAAYLGTDQRVISRSGAVVPVLQQRPALGGGGGIR